MANTTNLNLVKPAGTDYALVSVINGNMDIIDSKVGAIPANESAQSQITALNNQIANKAQVICDYIGANASKTIDVSSCKTCLIVFGRGSASSDCTLLFRDNWGSLLVIKSNATFSVTNSSNSITATNGATVTANILIIGMTNG